MASGTTAPVWRMIAAASAVVFAGAADTGAVDLHRLWDDRCQSCHGHSADFARGRPSLAERPALDVFLQRHGDLAEGVAVGVRGMLEAQARTPPRWRDRCRICHGPAAAFVRQRLVRTGTGLENRLTHRPVAPFLLHHARQTPAEVAFFLRLLERLEGEVRFDPEAIQPE